MSRLIVLAGLVFLLSVSAARADDPPSRATLVLHATAAPTPALKYRLLPSFFDRRPGNAAPMYAKAMLLLGKEAKDDERRKLLLDGPLAECTREATEPLVADSAFELLGLGALRDRCDWELPFHEQNAIMIALPELQEMRRLAGAVVLRARARVAAGKFGDAVDSLRIAYAMARHTAETPLLINGLVGQSIQGQADQVLLELVQQPGAPNLYWSLAVLPRPLVDGLRGFEGEMHILELGWKWWSEMPDRIPPDAVLEKFLDDYVLMVGMAGMSTLMSPQESAASAVAALRTAGRGKEVRDYLVRVGVAADRIPGLTDLQIAMLFTRLKYDELRDDSFRWIAMPYAEAKIGLTAAAARLRTVRSSDEEILPLAALLMPAVVQAKQQYARGERRTEVLRLIEALRIHAAGHDGRLPRSLDELTTTPIAHDAITGKPFVYRADDDGATLTLPEEFSGREEPLVYEIRMAAKK